MRRGSSTRALAVHVCLASAGAAVALAPAMASAAPPAPPPAHDRSNSQFTLRRDEPGGADATTARTRARAGDCAGALPSFDAAIRITIEPTLRRDRGLCHEKLGHPYPAIDDYRAYLTARPDASDADQIRERLARLEEQTGQGGPSSEQVRESSNRGGASGEASVSIGSGGASASSKSSGGSSSSSGKSYEDYLAEEKLADAADESPLRYGQGWILGPFVHIPRYFFGNATSNDLAYAIGGTIRYSTGPTFTVLSEIGYGAIGTSGENTSAGGPLLFLGGELRVPISHYASDHILIGGGLGFERYVVSGTKLGVDLVPLRGRLGYRHVFGPSVGLELAFDGGVAQTFPDEGDGQTIGIAGGTVAFLIAF
jgi:hypothetical protein